MGSAEQLVLRTVTVVVLPGDRSFTYKTFQNCWAFTVDRGVPFSASNTRQNAHQPIFSVLQRKAVPLFSDGFTNFGMTFVAAKYLFQVQVRSLLSTSVLASASELGDMVL